MAEYFDDPLAYKLEQEQASLERAVYELALELINDPDVFGDMLGEHDELQTEVLTLFPKLLGYFKTNYEGTDVFCVVEKFEAMFNELVEAQVKEKHD